MKHFMDAALQEALAAARENETPVGAVMVKDGEIICRAHNTAVSDCFAGAHAEINAIKAAGELLGSANLSGCELYVTLEPCPMCACAIVLSKISKLVFGAYDTRCGACGSRLNIMCEPYNSKIEVYGGIREEECAALLKDFFVRVRGSSV